MLHIKIAFEFVQRRSRSEAIVGFIQRNACAALNQTHFIACVELKSRA